MTAAAIISRCVDHCSQARDWRGRWREERACRAALEAAGTPDIIAAMTASAAARVGAGIASFSARQGEAGTALGRRSVDPSEPARLCAGEQVEGA